MLRTLPLSSYHVAKPPIFIPFYLLPVDGEDVVLGPICPLSADISIPKLYFTYNNKDMAIVGDPKPCQHPQHTTTYGTYSTHTPLLQCAFFFTKLLNKRFKIPWPNKKNNRLPSHILTLGNHKHYQILSYCFQTPHGQLPTRPHEHHISLSPNTSTINVNIYRYPYSQKEAITTIIHDVLQEGIIKLSNNLYSYFVLLVQKNGAYHFCVDYHALNAITVHDHFHIPTINELFD